MSHSLLLVCAIVFAVVLPASATPAWKPLNLSPSWTKRAEHQTVTTSAGIVLAGGYDMGDIVFNDVYTSIDGTTWNLACNTAPWTARYYHAMYMKYGSNGAADTIFLQGGFTAADTPKNDVWSSKMGTTWSLVTSAAQWTSRGDFAGLAYNSLNLAIAGTKPAGLSGPPQVYNDVWSSPTGAAWTMVCAAPGWTSRSGLQVVMLEESMMLMGGSHTDTVEQGTLLNDVWSSSDGGASWVEITPNAEWSGRTGFSAIVWPDPAFAPNKFRLWVIGGASKSGGFQNDVYWFSPLTGSRFTKSETMAEWAARAGQSVTVMNNNMILTGGENANGVIADSQTSTTAIMCYLYGLECDNHGTCPSGVCVCSDDRFSGPNCGVPVCNPPCDMGTCYAPNSCLCDEGWSGATCNQNGNGPSPSPPSPSPPSRDPALTIVLVLAAVMLIILGGVYCFLKGTQRPPASSAAKRGGAAGGLSAPLAPTNSAPAAKSHGAYNEL